MDAYINTKDFIFEPVTTADEHISILYMLLSNRQKTISHSRMPNYSTHEKFVKNHPYRSWFLVKSSKYYIGSFYVTKQNTIGINVFEENTRAVLLEIVSFVCINYKPLPPIPSVRGGRFAINVPPGNTSLAEALEEIGAQILQITYTIPIQNKK